MPVAAVSLRPLFPSQAPRIPIPRSPPPRCRVSRLTGIVLRCVGKAVHIRGEPSGSWSSPCFHSLGTSCARKGMLFNKKRACYSIRPELVTLHETDKSRMKFFSTASWELSMRSRGGALTARGFRGLLPVWEQCPACLRGSRSRGAFPAGLYFCKEFGSFGKAEGGKNPARSVCLARNYLLILRWGGWRAVQRLPRALQHGEAGALCRVLHFGLQLGSAENTACGGRDGGNGARRRSSATAPVVGGAEGKGQGRSWCQGLAVSCGLSTSTGERVWSSLSSMCW